MTTAGIALVEPRRPTLFAVAAVAFMASMAILLQAFVAVKLAFLLIFLVVAGVGVAVRGRLVLHPRLLVFYLATTLLGIVWALVGLLYPGTYVTGILEALRLYCIWSLAFALLYTLLRSRPSLSLVHTVMVVAGLGVGLINLVGLADTAAGWGLVSESLRKELNLGVGIGEGTVIITSLNIGALFLIVPYLVALHLRTDAEVSHPWLAKTALVLSVATALLSGRRALWLVVLLTPVTIFLVAVLSGGLDKLKVAGRRFLLVATLGGALGVGVLAVLPEMPETSAIGWLQAAFSAQDERSLQKPYLIQAFKETPVFGSGFGAYAGYSRSEDRPWNYELTYHRMLFNMGVVGTLILVALFASYFIQVLLLLRRNGPGSAIPFGLLVGLFSFLIGAYSNPYFGSFDPLFFVGLLPYLATFRRGFDERGMTSEAVV